ncbi:hypothetical protein [Seonamhaeicola aphaedonensis]|uniref:Cytochrome c domain-containing protein n=1 Tax=Seonamhaeicola aphaedonensis TaxID=1461338 RepID=A0A3D9H6E7_9FLAO|nr:hypothetical protein [Seonamhaeicola aphaedonensis]RED44721.1 hypothetical protein DFQ02_11024 [Seonamhaeicola aphaedonensis]
MKKLFKIVLACGLTLICFSCYYNEFPELEDVVIDPNEEVSFVNDIVPIFSSNNCSQCHNANLDPDLRAGNEYSSLIPDYVTAQSPNTSKLYTKLAVENHRELDATSIALIKKWIDDGAENN